MKPNLLIIVLAAGIFTSNNVVANEKIPSFPSERYCAAVAGFVGDLAIIKEGCLEQEKTQHANIERVWKDIPDSARKDCIKLASISNGGSFQALSGCLLMYIGREYMNGNLILSKAK
jgi:hypothetical protein